MNKPDWLSEVLEKLLQQSINPDMWVQDPDNPCKLKPTPAYGTNVLAQAHKLISAHEIRGRIKLLEELFEEYGPYENAITKIADLTNQLKELEDEQDD